MAYFEYKDIAITGIATAVPKRKVQTEDYTEQFGERHIRKFIRTTGVKERRIVEENQTASDLGYVAAKELLKKKNVNPSEIGALIFASHGPDYRRPATSFVLQKRLGIPISCACFDINLGCSAFVYATQVVAGLMSNSDIEKALVIVGDTNSKIVNPKDESMILLTGDAGSAILFEKKKGGHISAELSSEGEKYKTVIVPAGGMRNPKASEEVMMFSDGNERTLYNLFMDGFGVFQYTIREVPKAIRSYLEREEKEMEDFDYYVMHQANQYILQQLSKRLKMPEEKMPKSIDRYGNTSSASVPLTLCDYFGDKQGEKFKALLSGFGVGLSCGIMSTELCADDIFPIIETDDYFEEGFVNSPEDWQLEREE